jgi:Helix-turn-helix domain
MNAPIPRIQSAAAARILGVSQRSVQGLALRGELPGAARIGGVWTFDAERLATFVEQRECDAERRWIPDPASSPPRPPTRAQTNAAYERVMAGRYSRSAAH